MTFEGSTNKQAVSKNQGCSEAVLVFPRVVSAVLAGSHVRIASPQERTVVCVLCNIGYFATLF
jgi:hypothetical protein